MVRVKDIHSVTDFSRNTKAYVAKVEAIRDGDRSLELHGAHEAGEVFAEAKRKFGLMITNSI